MMIDLKKEEEEKLIFTSFLRKKNWTFLIYIVCFYFPFYSRTSISIKEYDDDDRRYHE